MLTRIDLFARIGLIVVSLITLAVATLSGSKGLAQALPGPPDRRAGVSARPELNLTVNGADETTITPGLPLVFELVLWNRVASQAAGAEESRTRLKADLDGLVQTGRLSRRQADDLFAKEPVPTAVPAMVVTVTADRFSFRREGPRGGTALPWDLTIVDPVAPIQVTLDETEIGRAVFVVASEATVSTPKGIYLVRASFENRSSGQWRGHVTSDPVVITVAGAPAEPTAEQREEKHLTLGEYALALKDYDRALATARQVLTDVPHSIHGYKLLAKAQEAKGDLRAALEAYEKALDEWVRRAPVGGHPPWVLMRSIVRVQNRLGIQLPTDIGDRTADPPARR